MYLVFFIKQSHRLILIGTHLHMDRFACLLVVTILLNKVAAILEGGGGFQDTSFLYFTFYNPILRTRFGENYFTDGGS
jgi:hypothetical protein